MLEDHCLSLLRVNLLTLSRCDTFLGDLGLVTEMRELSVDGEAVRSITMDSLALEIRLYDVLRSISDRSIDVLNDCAELASLASDIFYDKMFKLFQERNTGSTIWSSLVNFLARQWSIKLKKMILTAFRVTDNIDHLGEGEREAIRLLGRAARGASPYEGLMGTLEAVSDDYRANERVVGRRQFAVLGLRLAELRVRGGNTTVAEMLKDQFSYRLSHSGDFSLQTDVSPDPSQLPRKTDLSHPSNILTTPVFGHRVALTSPPLVLVLAIDRDSLSQCIDGSRQPMTVLDEDSLFSFPEFVTGDDLVVRDARLSYEVVAVETCGGSLFLRHDGGWQGGLRKTRRRGGDRLPDTTEQRLDRALVEEGVLALTYLRRNTH